ncbi:hypothetical protein BDV36DRAFT_244677 [Aspergillus pseudocaelatus]|uniref:BED-type domain-containing protein n=1 Tax=Aspergillus pseudocaelatus TaxID=1825620 RepID=A0ABQ6X1W6_9EURO|nr:hypothetical protein BDV36DRAFT_244677 [Aspergillus pseudocaelatus]
MHVPYHAHYPYISAKLLRFLSSTTASCLNSCAVISLPRTHNQISRLESHLKSSNLQDSGDKYCGHSMPVLRYKLLSKYRF